MQGESRAVSEPSFTYSACIYFVISSMSASASGEIYPSNTLERGLISFVMLFGVAVYAYAVTSVIFHVSFANTAKQRMTTMKDQINRLIRHL